MTSTDHLLDPPAIISGLKSIGLCLGVSEDTVARMIKAGTIKVFRTGANTSPVKCTRAEIRRVKATRELEAV